MLRDIGQSQSAWLSTLQAVCNVDLADLLHTADGRRPNVASYHRDVQDWLLGRLAEYERAQADGSQVLSTLGGEGVPLTDDPRRDVEAAVQALHLDKDGVLGVTDEGTAEDLCERARRRFAVDLRTRSEFASLRYKGHTFKVC